MLLLDSTKDRYEHEDDENGNLSPQSWRKSTPSKEKKRDTEEAGARVKTGIALQSHRLILQPYHQYNPYHLHSQSPPTVSIYTTKTEIAIPYHPITNTLSSAITDTPHQLVHVVPHLSSPTRGSGVGTTHPARSPRHRRESPASGDTSLPGARGESPDVTFVPAACSRAGQEVTEGNMERGSTVGGNVMTPLKASG